MSSEALQKLFSLSLDLFGVTDFEGRIRMVNPAFTRLLGWAPKDLVGKPFFEFIHPDDLAATVSQTNLFGSGVTAVHFENRYRTASGDYRWLAWTAQPDPQDRLVYSVARDITEAREQRQRLEAAHLHLRSVVDSIPGIVWILNRNGRGEYLNRFGLDYCGLSPDDVLGGGWLAVAHHPEDHARIRQSLAEVFGKEGPYYGEHRIRRADGEFRWHLAHGVPFTDPVTGELTWIGTCTEIEDLKRSETRLRDAERKTAELLALFQGVLENAPIGIGILDADNRFLYSNAALEVADGLSASERLGRLAPELAPQLWSVSGAFVDEVRQRRQAVLNRPLTNPEADAHFLVNFFPVETQDGELLAVGMAGTDISEHKRTSDELAEVSHRLLRAEDDERRRIGRELHDSSGQLLVALSLNLSALERSLRPVGLTDSQRSLMAESASMAAACLKEVRTLSFLLHPPLLDELGLQAALTVLAEGLSRRSALDIQVDVPAGLRLPPDIETAVFRIAQEALSNVHKHSGSRHARVSLVVLNGRVAVQISDKGRGIAPGILGDDAVPRSTYAGVGLLGMRERVQQLGGSLHIQSGEGGTTITASFPHRT